MATHKPEFIFDRAQDADILEKRFDRNLSLRWQFIQAQAGKPLCFVLLPRLSRPPQHPDQEPPEEVTDGVYVIADELKSLYKDRRLELNGRTSCQERLAKALGKTWHLLHIGKITDYPPNFLFRHDMASDVVPSIMSQTHHQIVLSREIYKLQSLITDNRYDEFLRYEKKARDGMKLAEASISKLEVGITRQHNAMSEEYQAWLEKNRNNYWVLNTPFVRTPDVDTNSGWYAWFSLEEQL